MRRAAVLMVVIVLGLAACADNNRSPATNNGNIQGQMGLFDWERDPNTIIVRLDSLPDQESPAFILNRIPPCTLWGDGRVVWSTLNDRGEEEILEGRIDEATMRAFLEDIINRGFYGWEDDLIPPVMLNPIIESLTVYLYGETRTVRRYSFWPQNSYQEILRNCQHLSDQPVLVQPQAGWVSAYAVPRNAMSPTWWWPPNAPFTLKELADNGEARWLEGRLALEVWLSARAVRGDIQVLERGSDSAYQVAITVPGISRDAAPPPTAQ